MQYIYIFDCFDTVSYLTEGHLACKTSCFNRSQQFRGPA